MATRSIVTSQPDVICDVCGRRLLRGENADVFIAGGRRRNVCELCAPRAADEGWLRERDNHTVSLPPARARRRRNLLGRLRQLRDPAPEPELPPAPAAPDGSGEEYEFLPAGAEAERAPDASQATRPVPAPLLAAEAAGDEHAQARDDLPTAPRSGEVRAQRALDVFNAGEHPRRVGGIARSLGAPSVSVRPVADSGSRVRIVIAWELCWYRYEVDLGDEQAGAAVLAQGTELGELDERELLVNATATDQGMLSLVGSVLR